MDCPQSLHVGVMICCRTVLRKWLKSGVLSACPEELTILSGHTGHASLQWHALVLSPCWVRRTKATCKCGALRGGLEKKHNNLREGEVDMNVTGLTLVYVRVLCNAVGVANETLSAW